MLHEAAAGSDGKQIDKADGGGREREAYCRKYGDRSSLG
jgi:hypothetical protein